MPHRPLTETHPPASLGLPPPSGPLAKAAPSARSGPHHTQHQRRPAAIVPAGARAKSAGARSEARSSEVSAVSSLFSAPSERSRRRFGPAATPQSIPALIDPLARPTRFAPVRLPIRATPTLWVDSRRPCVTLHSLSSLHSTAGPRLFVDLLPTLARKTLFASLRETSSRPFVHMDSPERLIDVHTDCHSVRRELMAAIRS